MYTEHHPGDIELIEPIIANNTSIYRESGKQRHILSRDILRGADQIAAFLFGDPLERRKVYGLAEARELPVFRLGRIICARKSTLLGWIAGQETTLDVEVVGDE